MVKKKSYDDIEKVWTNIMTLAVNEGLEKKYFMLDHTSFINHDEIEYDFTYNDLIFHVEARDCGYEEIKFNVYVNWNNNGKYKIYDLKKVLNTFDIYVLGWLERKTDFHLMKFSKSSIGENRNKEIMETIMKWDIKANGYKQTGKFII